MIIQCSAGALQDVKSGGAVLSKGVRAQFYLHLDPLCQTDRTVRREIRTSGHPASIQDTQRVRAPLRRSQAQHAVLGRLLFGALHD